MFLGHFGAAFGAKTAAPRVSLGTMFLAAQFADLLWPTLLLLGIERVKIVPGLMVLSPMDFEYYPFSHSLLLGVVWGVVLGGGYWLVRRQAVGAVAVGLTVVSHWLLDLPMHRPDLPLFPGASPLLGLGLWNHPVATYLLEFGLLGAGLLLYLRATVATSRVGSWGLAGLVGFLVLSYVSSALSPPPASPTAIAWFCQLMWLPVAWAYWVDRHRAPRRAAVRAAETRQESAPSIS